MTQESFTQALHTLIEDAQKSGFSDAEIQLSTQEVIRATTAPPIPKGTKEETLLKEVVKLYLGAREVEELDGESKKALLLAQSVVRGYLTELGFATRNLASMTRIVLEQAERIGIYQQAHKELNKEDFWSMLGKHSNPIEFAIDIQQTLIDHVSALQNRSVRPSTLTGEYHPELIEFYSERFRKEIF